GEIGRDLHADEAVGAARAVVDRTQRVGRRLDIGDRQLLVEGHHVLVATGDRRAQRRVVAVAAADGPLEDGGIGGDAGEPILADEFFEVAALNELPRQEVEPDRLAMLGQRAYRIHRRAPPILASCSRAAASTRAPVKPNLACTSLPGAEAPNSRMPIITPLSPTYRSQPITEACSTATRATTSRGSTVSR